MKQPEIFYKITSQLNPDLYIGDVPFEVEFLGRIQDLNLPQEKRDAFIAYIDYVTHNKHSDALCGEVWATGGSRLIMEESDYRRTLLWIRDIVRDLRLPEL